MKLSLHAQLLIYIYGCYYAAQFSTCDDLRAMIANGNYITIEIISKHALTGFTSAISKKKHKTIFRMAIFTVEIPLIFMFKILFTRFIVN